MQDVCILLSCCQDGEEALLCGEREWVKLEGGRFLENGILNFKGVEAFNFAWIAFRIMGEKYLQTV